MFICHYCKINTCLIEGCYLLTTFMLRYNTMGYEGDKNYANI